MERVLRLTLAASLGLVCASAYAVSPSQQQCESAGGSFDRVNGEVICVYPEENVGNAPPHSNSQTTQTTTTGQGNSGNKPTEGCSGPPGQCN